MAKPYMPRNNGSTNKYKQQGKKKLPKFGYDETKNTFINPYNFIGVEKIEKSNRSFRLEEKLSGSLHCILTTKTPLAMLDVEGVEPEKLSANKTHPIYKTYKLGEKPAIPGSSLRGPIRAVYETVTNSCFVTEREDSYISKRVAAADAYNAGILIRTEKGEWELYSAKRWLVKTFPNMYEYVENNGHKERVLSVGKNLFYNGDCLYIDRNKSDSIEKIESNGCEKTIVKRFQKDRKNSSRYVLFVGEQIWSKKHESVFVKGNKLEISTAEIEKALKLLEYNLEIYRDKAINRNLGDKWDDHWGYYGYERAKRNGILPIWYSKTGTDFSLACIGRKTYDNTVYNFLEKKNLQPCSNRNDVCPACSLFGMIGKKSDDLALGSRVRFSDAIMKTEYKDTPPVLLKELSSPRPGYYLFYGKDGKEYDVPGADINGRKYYWHIPKAATDPSVYTSDEKTDRNASVELINAGTVYEFDVFFDGITKEELDNIKWALTLGENTIDGKYCQKIGHGKPIGLGSVKICIEKQTIRSFCDGIYKIEEAETEEINAESLSLNGTDLQDKKYVKDLLYISDFSQTENIDVCYPYIEPNPSVTDAGENDLASHKWFYENKRAKKRLLPIKNSKLTRLKTYKIKKNY